MLSNALPWTETVTAVSSAVGALGIALAAAGAWFAFSQLREARRDRHIQVLSEYGRRWDDAALAEAREKVLSYTSDQLAAKAGEWLTPPREAFDFPVLLRIPNFFEDLAIMVECGRLKLQYVSKSFRSIALKEWDYWRPAIKRMQEYNEHSYAEFEKLVADLRKLG